MVDSARVRSSLRRGRNSAAALCTFRCTEINSSFYRPHAADCGVSDTEIIVVARPKMNPPTCLERDRTIAVEFQLVL